MNLSVVARIFRLVSGSIHSTDEHVASTMIGRLNDVAFSFQTLLCGHIRNGQTFVATHSDGF